MKIPEIQWIVTWEIILLCMQLKTGVQAADASSGNKKMDAAAKRTVQLVSDSVGSGCSCEKK